MLDSDTLSQRPTPEIKQGEHVSVTFGFNKDKLAQLDPSTLASESSWDYEGRVTRAKEVIEVFGNLPETLRLEPGVTVIFGENGKGKTLLADAVVMGVKMEQYRRKNGIPNDVDILSRDAGDQRYYPMLPGRLNSSPHSIREHEDEHAMFVARIADCIDFSELVLHDPESEVGAAMRTPAALGNVAMGMSSRQAVDYLESMDRPGKASQASIRIYDEPELGMSPRRQRELVPMLMERVEDGAIELVPSNSILLYESDLPRIDLDTPELGVYTPEAGVASPREL